MNTHTSAQSKKLIELLEQKGMTPERFQTVLGSGILSDVFEQKATLSNRFAVRQALGLGPLPSEPIVLIVDYGLTLEQMIAAGRYDWKNDNITIKHFPTEGKGTVEFEAVLFHFNKDISSEDAKKQIEEAGYEVGKIEHVLSFGANYPEEQRKYPIVGLGSVGKVDGYRHVPCLGRNGSERSLDLGWWGTAGAPTTASSRFAKWSLRPWLLELWVLPLVSWTLGLARRTLHATSCFCYTGCGK